MFRSLVEHRITCNRITTLQRTLIEIEFNSHLACCMYRIHTISLALWAWELPLIFDPSTGLFFWSSVLPVYFPSPNQRTSSFNIKWHIIQSKEFLPLIFLENLLTVGDCLPARCYPSGMFICVQKLQNLVVLMTFDKGLVCIWLT